MQASLCTYFVCRFGCKNKSIYFVHRSLTRIFATQKKKTMKIIDTQLLDEVSQQAKQSERLRKNYNFHQSLEDKCHRFLNAVEPGTEVPIHRHPTKDESFVILRGKVKVSTYNDDGTVLDSIVLCAEEGRYGVDIPKGVWHAIESLEPDSVIFECKEGPFVEHEVEGILEVPKK